MMIPRPYRARLPLDRESLSAAAGGRHDFSVSADEEQQVAPRPYVEPAESTCGAPSFDVQQAEKIRF